MTLSVLSLCSGYGGLDLAVEAVFNAETVAHAECESAPSKVLAERWPGVPNLGDITSADWDTVTADIITAGYPCQPDSLAGKGLSTNDDRWIFPDVARAVGVVRPRIVVLENVPGHFVRGFRTVLGTLTELGYDAEWTLVRASDVGAPHKRERLFVVAADTRGEAVGFGSGLRPGELCGQRRGRSDDHTASAFSNPDRDGWAGRTEASTRGWSDGSRPRADDQGRGDDVVPDAARDRRDEGWTESAGILRGSDATQRSTNALTDSDDTADDGQWSRTEPLNRIATPATWGKYGPAIRRWETTLRRLAPAPTENGPKGGQRLSPRFVEWMMGLPAGWVTDIDGITRNEQLKMLGNGVVPQQAIAALTMLGLQRAAA